jgi:Mrp family chromosome partitioning ATPase
VLTAGSGHQWESELVSVMSRPGARLRVVRRCVDIADVVAVASTGQISVAIVAADLRRLDAELVQRLRSGRVAVVAVHPAGDPATVTRLNRIGIPVTVADDAGAEAIVAAVGEAVAELATATAAPGDQDWFGDTRTALPAAGSFESSPPSASVGSGSGSGGGAGGGVLGRVIAVWGPTGAPGRTTVAAGLAAEVAAAGVSTLLVDADVYGGVLASAFGLLDESPGLAGACRMAANGRLGPVELTTLSWRINDELTLLTGIPRPDRWPEVRPSSIPLVLEVARALAAVVVVDCGFSLESDEEISFDTVAPRRNGATLAVLSDADVVLAVGSADPPGMERLVRGLLELADVLPGVQPRVVLNRLRRTAASREDAVGALRRFAGVPVTAALPEDRAGTDLAWQRGVPLAEAAAGSPLRGGLRELAESLSPRVVSAG